VINFIKAVYHCIKLKTDTHDNKPKRLFTILSLVGNKRYLKTRQKFLANPNTASLLKEDKTLSILMADYIKFKDYKEGTLGKELYNFLKDEEIDYTKFVTDYGNFTDEYDKRERDMHDIIHIIFGYSRSRFGEGATIATHYWQGNYFGLALVMFIGVIRQAITKPSTAKITLTGFMDAYKRQKGIDLHSYPFEYNFKKDINKIRAELGIPKQTKTIQILDKYSSWG